MIPENGWHNFAERETAEDGSLRLSRVPVEMLPRMNDRVQRRAYSAAGSELRFRLGSDEARITLRRVPDPQNPVSNNPPAAILAGVFRGDFQSAWIALDEGDTVVTVTRETRPECAPNRYRFHPELIRIVFPVMPEVRLVAVEGTLLPPQPDDAPAVKYLAYGSSITMGAFTPLGSATYPGVAGRELGVDVLNLGFGGGAHLEAEMGDWIVSRSDWSFASLEMGINLMGQVDTDEFRRRVRRFLKAFAEDTHKRPVACLDLLPHGGEFGDSPSPKVADFRRIVGEETAALRLERIRHVPYAPALARAADLSDDLLHPSAHAFETIGRYLAGQFRGFPEIAALLSR